MHLEIPPPLWPGELTLQAIHLALIYAKASMVPYQLAIFIKSPRQPTESVQWQEIINANHMSIENALLTLHHPQSYHRSR